MQAWPSDDAQGAAPAALAHEWSMMRTLNDLRKDIDRVDEVLVRLLNERARCACEVGRLKKELGIEIYQPEREKEVLNHVRTVACEGPLGPDAIARLFERIIDEARRLERRVVHGDDSKPSEEGAVKAEPNLKSET